MEDQQSAAEALFKAAEERPSTLYQPATFPFFARAYYVGMKHYGCLKFTNFVCMLVDSLKALQVTQSICHN